MQKQIVRGQAFIENNENNMQKLNKQVDFEM